MSDFLRDGNWSSPQIDGPPRFSAPLPNTSALYLLEQDYLCDEISFTPTALNTVSPDFPTYYLVEEGSPQSPGSGVRKWTRKYAKIPDSWTDAGGNYSYNFIGIDSLPSYPTGRNRQVIDAPLRIQRDYYLVGTGGSFATYEALVLANTIPQQLYYFTLYQSAYVDKLTPVGSDVPTTPSGEQYLAWVSSGAEITVDTSVFSRWMGNIFVRETRYVKAK
jgi:hypothetical protein